MVSVQEVSLEPGVHWLGSAVDCRLRIIASGVIGRHARVEMSADGKYGIVDMGGPQSTRVNGERIVTAGPLGPWDVVRLGDNDYRFVRQLEQECDTVAQSESAEHDTDADPNQNSAKGVTAEIPPEDIGRDTDAVWLAAAGRLHQRLIEQLDLRRRDVAAMADGELRELAKTLLQPLAAEEALRLPGQQERLLHFVLDESLGLGPLEELLRDDEVGEIMVNGPDTLFVEKSGRISRSEKRFSGELALRGIVERIVAPIGRRVDDASPMVDARLPDGSRVNVVLHPLAVQGTAVTIRRFGRRRLGAADLLAYGSMSADMLEFLRVCVVHRRNIIVSGGTGSGKTTLLNALSSLIPQHERVITIEDSAELAFDHQNLVALETRPRNIEGRGEITIRDLVRNALRMRPDRIVVGECRGGETLDMLQAMNTGHDGSLSTVHANSPRELLSRLEVMVLMSGVELPISAVREQIAGSVNIIVHQARLSSGRRCITRITEVAGLVSGTIQTQDIFRLQQPAGAVSAGGDHRFVACGHMPQFYEDLMRAGVDLDLKPFAGAVSV